MQSYRCSSRARRSPSAGGWQGGSRELCIDLYPLNAMTTRCNKPVRYSDRPCVLDAGHRYKHSATRAYGNESWVHVRCESEACWLIVRPSVSMMSDRVLGVYSDRDTAITRCKEIIVTNDGTQRHNRKACRSCRGDSGEPARFRASPISSRAKRYRLCAPCARLWESFGHVVEEVG